MTQTSEASVEAGAPEALRRVTEISERLRSHAIAQREIVDERNAAIREAIDLYQCSHRQVARAAGLTLGRIHGVLAND